MILQLFLGLFFFFNFVALIAGVLLSFLLTFWRARLMWIDWMIVLLLNLPTALFLKTFLGELVAGWCRGFCLGMTLGGASFGMGLPLGLLCSMWVIAARPEPDI
jgi:hypothetical protein